MHRGLIAAVIAPSRSSPPALRALVHSLRVRRSSRLSSIETSGPPRAAVSRVPPASPGNPLLYYAATASGGVWMSADGGTSWKSGVRQSACVFDRFDRDCAERSERRLRRVGRSEHPRKRRRRQRDLQVDRRRQDLDPRVGPGRPDRHDGRRSQECRRRVRGRTRPRVRTESGAWHLPNARRRQDLGAGAEEGRGHRRLRCRNRSLHALDRLRGLLAGTPFSVGSAERRSRQRPLRVTRRRRHVEAAHRQRAA